MSVPRMVIPLGWLGDLLGLHWPEGDEDALRRVGQAWTTAAQGVLAAGRDGTLAASNVLAAIQAPSADDFTTAWQHNCGGKHADGQGTLDQLTEQCAAMARYAEFGALQIEGAKWQANTIAVITYIQVLRILATIAASLGTAAPVEAGEIAAERAAAETAFKMVLKAAGQALLFTVLPDFISQTAEILDHHRSGYDGSALAHDVEHALLTAPLFAAPGLIGKWKSGLIKDAIANGTELPFQGATLLNNKLMNSPLGQMFKSAAWGGVANVGGGALSWAVDKGIDTRVHGWSQGGGPFDGWQNSLTQGFLMGGLFHGLEQVKGNFAHPAAVVTTADGATFSLTSPGGHAVDPTAGTADGQTLRAYLHGGAGDKGAYAGQATLDANGVLTVQGRDGTSTPYQLAQAKLYDHGQPTGTHDYTADPTGAGQGTQLADFHGSGGTAVAPADPFALHTRPSDSAPASDGLSGQTTPGQGDAFGAASQEFPGVRGPGTPDLNIAAGSRTVEPSATSGVPSAPVDPGVGRVPVDPASRQSPNTPAAGPVEPSSPTARALAAILNVDHTARPATINATEVRGETSFRAEDRPTPLLDATTTEVASAVDWLHDNADVLGPRVAGVEVLEPAAPDGSVHARLRLADGGSHDVRVRIVDGLGPGQVAVSRPEHGGYTVELPRRIAPEHIARALGHEFTEQAARPKGLRGMLRRAGNIVGHGEPVDALRFGGVSKSALAGKLSAHDEGRLTEVRVLNRLRETAADPAAEARLAAALRDLRRHLGLSDGQIDPKWFAGTDPPPSGPRPNQIRRALVPRDVLDILDGLPHRPPDSPAAQPLPSTPVPIEVRWGDPAAPRPVDPILLHDDRVLASASDGLSSPYRPMVSDALSAQARGLVPDVLSGHGGLDGVPHPSGDGTWEVTDAHGTFRLLVDTGRARGDNASVAAFDLAGNVHVILVSDGLAPEHVERTLAHQIGRIAAERDRQADPAMRGAPDVRILDPSAAPPEPGDRLGGQDRGRVQETRVLGEKLAAAEPTAASTPEELAHYQSIHTEAHLVVDELGIREGMPGAQVRRDLIRAQLTPEGRLAFDHLVETAGGALSPEDEAWLSARRLQALRAAEQARQRLDAALDPAATPVDPLTPGIVEKHGPATVPTHLSHEGFSAPEGREGGGVLAPPTPRGIIIDSGSLVRLPDGSYGLDPNAHPDFGWNDTPDPGRERDESDPLTGRGLLHKAVDRGIKIYKAVKGKADPSKSFDPTGKKPFDPGNVGGTAEIVAVEIVVTVKKTIDYFRDRPERLATRQAGAELDAAHQRAIEEMDRRILSQTPDPAAAPTGPTTPADADPGQAHDPAADPQAAHSPAADPTSLGSRLANLDLEDPHTAGQAPPPSSAHQATDPAHHQAVAPADPLHQLPPHLADIFAAADHTPAGLSLHSDPTMREAAHHVAPDPNGLFTVDVEGLRDRVEADGYQLDVGDLAALIEADPTHVPGRGVLLLSCDTGAGGDTSFAAQLARRLGEKVIAPDGTVWTDAAGHTFVTAGVDHGDGFEPEIPPTGRWLEFSPDPAVAPREVGAGGFPPGHEGFEDGAPLGRSLPRGGREDTEPTSQAEHLDSRDADTSGGAEPRQPEHAEHPPPGGGMWRDPSQPEHVSDVHGAMFVDPTPERLVDLGVGRASFSDLGYPGGEGLSPEELARYGQCLPRVAMVDPREIALTQRSVSRQTSDRVAVTDLAGIMSESGWRGGPVHAVLWGDGRLSSLDNRRITAARLAGHEAGDRPVEAIPVTVHGPNDPLDEWPQEWGEEKRARSPLTVDIRRLPDGTLRVGGGEGEIVYAKGTIARTWGEIALFRAAEQRSLLPGHLFGSEHTPVYADKPYKPEAQGSVSEEQQAVLSDAVKQAGHDADRIMGHLRSLADGLSRRLNLATPAELLGTQHRVKTLESLTRKFVTERGPDGEVGDFLAEVNDLVRFSVQLPEGAEYTAAVHEALNSLRSLGYHIGDDGIRNFWRAGNRYFGLNVTVTSPEGRSFEVQFPTEASWRANKLTHDHYEVFRQEKEPIERRIHGFLQTLRVNHELGLADRIPPGLDELSAPKDTGFAKWIRAKGADWLNYQDWLAGNPEADRRGVEWAIGQFGLDPAQLLSGARHDPAPAVEHPGPPEAPTHTSSASATAFEGDRTGGSRQGFALGHDKAVDPATHQGSEVPGRRGAEPSHDAGTDPATFDPRYAVPDLPAHLAEVFAASEPIPAGRSFHSDPALREAAWNIARHPDGLFIVDMEGDRINTYGGDTALAPEDLAALIAADPTHVPGQGVFLVSCETGFGGEHSYAARLARALGEKVVAADSTVWTDSAGNVFAATGVDHGNGRRPDVPPTGRWFEFAPDGSVREVGADGFPPGHAGFGQDGPVEESLPRGGADRDTTDPFADGLGDTEMPTPRHTVGIPLEQARYYGDGGLKYVELPFQQAVESAAPRYPDGRAIPFRIDQAVLDLINDGGPAADPGRGQNCPDLVRAVLETFWGNPQAAAAVRFEYDEHGDPMFDGELNGWDGIENWTGVPFVHDGAGSAAFDALEAKLRNAGFGAGAAVVYEHGPQLGLNGEVVHPGTSHAIAVVNIGGGKLLYLDAQARAISDRPPGNVGDVWSIVLDRDRRPIAEHYGVDPVPDQRPGSVTPDHRPQPTQRSPRGEQAAHNVRLAADIGVAGRTRHGYVADAAVERFLQEMPRLSAEVADPFAEFVADGLGPGVHTVKPLAGGSGMGASGAPVSLVLDARGEAAAILKLFPQVPEMIRELSAVERFGGADFKHFKVPEILNVAVTGEPGHEAGVLLASLAPGRSMFEMIAGAGVNKYGTRGRGHSIAELETACEQTGLAFGELHSVPEGSGARPVATVIVGDATGFAAKVLDRLEARADTLAEYVGPIDAVTAALSGAIAEARLDPGRATLTHGDGHPGNVFWDREQGVTFIDTPTAHFSMDADGRPIGSPARDLAKMALGLNKYGRNSGLESHEIGRLHEAFLRGYSEGGGPEVPEAAVTGYQVRSAMLTVLDTLDAVERQEAGVANDPEGRMRSKALKKQLRRDFAALRDLVQ